MASPRPLKIDVENAAELLNTGAFGAGALIHIQSSATEAGAYADLTGTGSTPTIALVAGTTSYTGYDPLGDWSTWYRVRYKSSDGARVSVDWTGDASWATRPGHAPFQAGDETGGLLCSLYDVKQELGETGTSRDELILEKIRQVSTDIEGFVGAWLAPRPTNPASTMTLLFDVERASRELLLESGSRRLGIRTLTSLGIATSSQPETSGTYTAATVADVLLRPRPTADGPASRLVFTNYPAGSVSMFYPGFNTVQVVGSFGPASVASYIQGIAARSVTRRVLSKGGGAVIGVGPSGAEFTLPDMSGADRHALERIRVVPVA